MKYQAKLLQKACERNFAVHFKIGTRMFNGKKVLVTGGTGMIGQPLVELLLEKGAQVQISSLDDSTRANPKAVFMRTDLRYFDQCLKACDGVDYVSI